jgi:hypothetical protein
MVLIVLELEFREKILIYFDLPILYNIPNNILRVLYEKTVECFGRNK